MRYASQAHRQGAHLPSFGCEPVGRYTAKSVMHAECDARPTATFPGAEDYHSLTDTTLYCLMTEPCRCK